MIRIFGRLSAKVDEKGRVFFPAAFRKLLADAGEGERMVMRKDIFERCLTIYPENSWNALVDEMRGRLSKWNAEHQRLFRAFVTDVEWIVLDKNGRLLIPRRYMEMACIEDEVTFHGMGETIELWARSDADALKDEQRSLGQSLQQMMQ